jgi:hypothetical protein
MTQALGPAARDASDRVTAGSVCWVTESVRNSYQLEYLHKAFTLDLIESVLTHFYYLPPVPQMLSERSAFPLALRGTRVVFHLLKQFSSELETEVEVILTLFIKLISSETDTGEPRPGRMRVLAMEIIPG